MRAAALSVWLAVIALQALLAMRLDLFADEAFYRLCALAPDWAYADHPGLTALLMRLGMLAVGDTALGLRAGFLLCGAALPWVIAALARGTASSASRAWCAFALVFTLPALGFAAGLGTPEAPLLVLAAGAMALLARATGAGGGRGAWAGAGLCAGLGLATHYRFSLVVAGVLLYLLGTRNGRAQWRHAGPWLAGGLSLIGLGPALYQNFGLGFDALGYQLNARHLQGAGPSAWLRQPAEQALLVTSPLMYVLLLAALWRCLRRARAGDDRAALLTCLAIVPLGVYFLSAPFADSHHVTLHWPLVGYLPLIVVVPGLLGELRAGGGLRRVLSWAAPASGLLMLGTVLVGSLLGAGEWLPPRKFLGWTELGERVQAELDRADRAGRPVAALVGDDYVFASELSFAVDSGLPVYALDHARNRVHGRGPQFALWRRDEAALLTEQLGQDLLVVEGDVRLPGQARGEWHEHVRGLFDELEELGQVEVSRRPVTLYRGVRLRRPSGER